MCVIIYKAAGVEVPTNEIFQACWDTNPDGFGMAVADGNKVTLNKGYMTMSAAQDAMRMIPKDHAAILHFRIGTSGKNDGPTCHPYPISNNADDLRTTHFECLPYAVAHNGIISSKGDGLLNDTQVWVRDKLSILYRPEFVASPVHKDLVQIFLDEAAESYSSRFVVLNADKSCYLSGTWHEHDSGLLFSNKNWMFYTTKKQHNYTPSSSWYHNYDKNWYNTKSTYSNSLYSSESARNTDEWDDYEYDNDWPTCPVCGSDDIEPLEGSQHNLCECYQCQSIFNPVTGDEYGVVYTAAMRAQDTEAEVIANEAITKAAYVKEA